MEAKAFLVSAVSIFPIATQFFNFGIVARCEITGTATARQKQH